MISSSLVWAEQSQLSVSPLSERYSSPQLFTGLVPICLCLPCTGEPRTGAFLFTLHIPHQIPTLDGLWLSWLQLSVLRQCLYISHRPPLPVSTSCMLPFHVWVLPGGHPCRPCATAVWFLAHQDRLFLNKWYLNIDQLSRIFWSRSLNTKFWFPESQGFNLAFCLCSLPSGSWRLPSYGYCSQGCSDLHLPDQFFLVFKSEVQ